MSIKSKLIFYTLIVTSLVWIAIGFTVFHFYSIDIQNLLDGHLKESAHVLLKQANFIDDTQYHKSNHHDDDEEEDDENHQEKRGKLSDFSNLGSLLNRSAQLEKRIMFEVYDAKKSLLHKSSKKYSLEPQGDWQNQFQTINQKGMILRTYGAWNENRSLYIIVGELEQERTLQIKKTIYFNLIIGFVGFISLITILFLMINNSFTSLNKFSQLVAKKSVSDLSLLPTEGVPKEISPLITSLNNLLLKLSSSIEKERQFTADAAHELRTPLAAIKIHAEVAKLSKDPKVLERSLTLLLQGVDEGTHLVEQLLTLARMESQFLLQNETCNLNEICRNILSHHPMVEDKRLTIKYKSDLQYLIRMSQSIAQILVKNIIDNAVKFSEVESTIEIAILQDQNLVLFEVKDSGPGFNESQLANLGVKFSRIGRASGEGAGLGLSIVRKILDLHHGTLSIANRIDHKGAIVQVRIEGFSG